MRQACLLPSHQHVYALQDHNRQCFLCQILSRAATTFSTQQQGQPGPHAASLTTPQHHTSAIQCLSQIDCDLSVWTCSAMITLFQENIAATDTYSTWHWTPKTQSCIEPGCRTCSRIITLVSRFLILEGLTPHRPHIIGQTEMCKKVITTRFQ